MLSPNSGLVLILSAGAALAAAVPGPIPDIGTRASTCIFTDAAAAIASKAACSTIELDGIVVPAGKTLDLTKLTTGTNVIFSGTTTFGYSEWSGPLVSISGTSITVSGASGSVLDGEGARWWDGKGTNGGKTKPKFFYAHDMISSSITGINIKDSPVQTFSINGAKDLVLSGVTIDGSAGDAGELGHNTDAFDVGSSEGVRIEGANVKNQDDCLAINSGTDITFTNGICSGGHGLSIGSVGGRSDNAVSGVVIEDSSVIDSDNGIRIKTVAGATGSVSNVTFDSITLTNIARYGIVIEQDYENGSPTGEPTTGVPITELTVANVSGSVVQKGKDIYIMCGEGSCSDWTWEGVAVTGGGKAGCAGVPTGASC